MTVKYEQEKQNMKKNMTVKMKKRKEAMTMRLQKQEQEQTAEMVQEHSKQMLYLLNQQKDLIRKDIEKEIVSMIFVPTCIGPELSSFNGKTDEKWNVHTVTWNLKRGKHYLSNKNAFLTLIFVKLGHQLEDI